VISSTFLKMSQKWIHLYTAIIGLNVLSQEAVGIYKISYENVYYGIY
jgi:hypothetical protein